MRVIHRFRVTNGRTRDPDASEPRQASRQICFGMAGAHLLHRERNHCSGVAVGTMCWVGHSRVSSIGRAIRASIRHPAAAFSRLHPRIACLSASGSRSRIFADAIKRNSLLCSGCVFQTVVQIGFHLRNIFANLGPRLITFRRNTGGQRAQRSAIIRRIFGLPGIQIEVRTNARRPYRPRREPARTTCA